MSNVVRNPPVCAPLYSSVLPALISESGSLKIWSLGRHMGTFGVKIVGSYLGVQAWKKRRGEKYPEGDLQEVKEKYLNAVL